MPNVTQCPFGHQNFQTFQYRIHTFPYALQQRSNHAVEHADKLKHAGDDDEYDSDATEIYKPGVTSGSCGTHFLNIDTNDNLVPTIQNLEDQCRQIFDKAHKSIKKAQIHQAKGYNNRQRQG